MRLYDQLTIDSTRKTSSGFMVVNAKVAKAGNVQVYGGAEVGKPEMSTVRIYRPRDEVLAARATFAHRPVTLDHPPQWVTADNWKRFARGWSGDEVGVEGDVIRVPLLLADVDAIEAVEGGKRQISMGYDCTLDWTPGTSPSGEAYDAAQRSIVGNHIAIVDTARGGPELTLDSTVHDVATIDAAMIDAEARRPEYDSVRGMLNDDGKPLDRHLAYLALERRGSDSQRSEATRDHMVRGLTDGRSEPPSVSDAYTAMIADQQSAWR